MRIVVVFALQLVIACAAHAEPIVLRGATMGTTYHIKLASVPDPVDVKQLHADVEKLLADVDRQMSTYRPDSELSRFNRAAAGEWFAVSAATAEVVAAAQEISEKTDGAMDVTVGPLVRLWHFGPGAAARALLPRPKGEGGFLPPTDEEIAAVKEFIGYEKLKVRRNPPALRKMVDGLEADLSSIAPGFAIDRIAKVVADCGIENFMVEIGGEVRAAGMREEGKPWRVGIAKPGGRATLMTSVPLNDAAIATAGNDRKFFEHEGKRYSHIIDPSTGRPTDHWSLSVTVVADTCLEADGWDTPLLVLGEERGFECAEKNGVAALFLDSSAKDGQPRETSAWRERFGEE